MGKTNVSLLVVYLIFILTQYILSTATTMTTSTSTRIVSEVFSSHLSLFVPCPNAVTGNGEQLDKYIPNPKYVIISVS